MARLGDGRRARRRGGCHPLLTDHRLGSLTIFATAFFVALFGIVITDLVSERMGVPRRGESWDDMRARAEWETERARRMEKRKARKAE